MTLVSHGVRGRHTRGPGASRRAPGALLAASTLVLGACAATVTPPASRTAVCVESRDRARDPGEIVAVNMENDPNLPSFLAAWVYAPRAITVRVGEAVVFTNRDGDTQHSAELDDGSCGTDFLDPGASDALIFGVTGTFPFHCLVHGTTMAGTITVVR